MGPKSSRHQKRGLPSNDNKYPPTKYRQYAKWDHQLPLTTLDVTRVVPREIDNFNKHNRIISPPPTTTRIPERSVALPAQHYAQTRKPRYEPDVPKPKLAMRKSRSVENLPQAKKFITAHELIDTQIKQKPKNFSSSSFQLSTRSNPSNHLEKSSSSTSVNQIPRKKNRKNLPDDHKFVLINSKDLQHAREIGKGNFGTVYHASYRGTRGVAIKSLHIQDENYAQGSDQENEASLHDLLHEAYIMTRLKHANLLRIIGVTFFGDRQQLSLVTDFMKNGSLLDYLKKNREMFLRADSRAITTKLNSFARQIFEAMSHLEERNIIHRDLAARNCLIGENDTLKVGDFGLTTLTDCGLYKGTYRSIFAPRWTSPEAVFFSKYSSRSDVWSYGITLWEIYSLGDRPFGGLTNFAVQAILKNSSETISRYLPKPKQFASDETYTHVILPSLTYSVVIRPRFKDLRERLVLILVDRSQ